jgi:hypothetical protein
VNVDSFLKDIGRSYIVSAFFPSTLFVSLGYLLFKGFIPHKLVIQIARNMPSSFGEWIALGLLIAWVAFYLYSSTDITVKLFEGYLFPKWLFNLLKGSLKNKEYTDFAPKYREYQQFNPGYDDLDEDGILELKEKGQKLWRHALQELQKLELRGPLDEENVLPTRLGNVFRASEVYAYERYWIEEITIWPRLISVIPAEYARTIEEKNNHLMFLLNSALLLYGNAVLCFIFGLAWLPCYLSTNLSICKWTGNYSGLFYIGYDFISPPFYLLIGVALIGFGYTLYRIGINSAVEIGMYIRASFDLYRMDLLRRFNFKPPKTLDAERDLWIDISTFFIAVSKLGKVNFPEYDFPDDESSSEKPKRDKETNIYCDNVTGLTQQTQYDC